MAMSKIAPTSKINIVEVNPSVRRHLAKIGFTVFETLREVPCQRFRVVTITTPALIREKSFQDYAELDASAFVVEKPFNIAKFGSRDALYYTPYLYHYDLKACYAGFAKSRKSYTIEIVQNVQENVTLEVFKDRFSHLIPFFGMTSASLGDTPVTVERFDGIGNIDLKIGDTSINLSIKTGLKNDIRLVSDRVYSLEPLSAVFRSNPVLAVRQMYRGRKMHIYDYFNSFYRDVYQLRSSRYFDNYQKLDKQIYEAINNV